MTSAESGSLKYHREKKDVQEEKRVESTLLADDYEVESKPRSQGISLNDFVQLHSPNRHGYVRYIGEIPNLNQNCDFFGIELSGKYKRMGKHEGTFRGIKFFTASDKSGIFCKRHKIKKVLKRSSSSTIRSPLKKLRQTDGQKLLMFARTVRRLRGLLSAGSLDDLNASFEKARNTTGLTAENSPFLSTVCLESRKKDANENPSNITSIELLRGMLSLSNSYSDSSTGEILRFTPEDAEVLSPFHGTKKVVKFAGISTTGHSTTDSNVSSEFLKLPTRHDTLGRILKSTMSTEQSADLKVELEEDFSLYAVSQEARESLKSKQDVKELITNLQICINVLKKHIPKVTKMLDVNDNENTVYMTNVIQDLLKRAQNEKLSKKILTDFSGIRPMNYHSSANAFTRNDITALVETMAWIRNNLCIAGLTDENDAMMTLMGAEEVQQSLVGILKKLDCQELLGTARRPSVPTSEPSLDINNYSEAKERDSRVVSEFV